MSFVLTISLIGSLAMYIRKRLSDRADQNMVQEIHITLEDQNQREPEQRKVSSTLGVKSKDTDKNIQEVLL